MIKTILLVFLALGALASSSARSQPVELRFAAPAPPQSPIVSRGIAEWTKLVTADSGNTRDQTSTVYEAQIPRGFLGWGNVSTLGFSLAGAVAAKLAYPIRDGIPIMLPEEARKLD